MKKLLFILSFFALLQNTHAQSTARNGKDYAVFFYVTEFENTAWESLPETEREAKELGKELKDNFGFDVTYVPSPSLRIMRQKLDECNKRSYNPDDQLFLFFTMHGHFDEEAENGYLIPKDGDKTDFSTWLSYNDLRTYLARNKCQHIYVGLDACHSGSFAEKSAPDAPAWELESTCSEQIAQGLRYKSRLFATSGSKSARTPGKSLFAKKTLETLRRGGKNGIISADIDLFPALKQVNTPRPQSGSFKGHEEGGDFIFIKKNTCGTAPPPPITNDRDADGIADSKDRCPDQFGTTANGGCPAQGDGSDDYDNDGFADTADACPTEYGTANGCPDIDRDGVPDKSDKCKNAFGKAEFEGCPDSDADGIPDNKDNCPNEKGTKTYNGCPPPVVKEVINSFADFEVSDIGNNTKLKMVAVKGGSFQMGSNEGSDEKPIHQVTVSDFYIGRYEITQKQWRAVMGTDPSYFKNCDDCPVEQVSWNDVQDFLTKLNSKTGKKYRLPTEAEWEYAARGGNKSNGYTYSGSNTIGDVAQYEGNNNKSTKSVGSKNANELGIYDMSGNVWEWCSDWYDSSYYKNSPSSNPGGASSGSDRVIRGGGWGNGSESCRVANRYGYTPEFRNDDLGFRVILSSENN